MKYLSIIALILVMVFAAVIVNAQSVPEGGEGPGGCTVLTPEEANAFLIGVGGAPAGAEVLGVYFCGGFGPIVLGNSNDLFDRACEAINVYKVSSEGDQDLWQNDSLVCNGDLVTIIAGGTGHYVVYGYGNQAAENSSPVIIQGLDIGGA
jgi:hypothetical protein